MEEEETVEHGLGSLAGRASSGGGGGERGEGQVRAGKLGEELVVEGGEKGCVHRLAARRARE